MSKSNRSSKSTRIVETPNVTNIDVEDIQITGGNISNVNIGISGPVNIVSNEIINGTMNIVGNTFSSSDPIVFTSEVQIGDLTFIDNTISSDTTVEITSPLIVNSISGSGEYLTMSNTFIAPSNDFNETFIKITGNTDITGSLTDPEIGFFEKRITVLDLNGNNLVLEFDNLVSPSGETDPQSVTFSSNGQGETFLWDLQGEKWYIRNGGCQVNFI
jgi:hypothetical protein